MVISATSLSDVSEMAMVPDNEWSIPTLIGSDDSARTSEGIPESIRQVVTVMWFKSLRLFMGVFVTTGCRMIVWQSVSSNRRATPPRDGTSLANRNA
jgi:hypothetical protein